MNFLEEKARKIWGEKHAANSTFHTIGGIGVGFLLMEYFSVGNLTWGWILVGVSLAGHIWAWRSK